MDQTIKATIEELGLRPGMRVRMTGDLGVELKSAAKAAINGSLLRSGSLDLIVRAVHSVDEADEFLGRVRNQIAGDGAIWLVTWKPGDPRHISRKTLIGLGPAHELKAGRICSIDDRRQALRFVAGI